METKIESSKRNRFHPEDEIPTKRKKQKRPFNEDAGKYILVALSNHNSETLHLVSLEWGVMESTEAMLEKGNVLSKKNSAATSF